MPAAPSARAAYRRWYAAAGPWAGFFRAVPLVALAHGAVPFPRAACDPPPGPSAALVRAGGDEGWLGRADVLLVLDLPGASSVATVAGLARWGVRPVLLVFLWPEPDALLPADALLGALLQHAPRLPAPAAPPSEPAQHGIGLGRERAMAPATAPSVQVAAQYALVLGRERASPASPADLATRFDNRYALGAIDLPSTARLRAGGVGAVVACRDRATPPAADLTEYLDGLEAAGVPIRRLALG